MQFAEAPVDLWWCCLDEREPVWIRGSLVNGKTRPQPGTSFAQPHLHIRISVRDQET